MFNEYIAAKQKAIKTAQGIGTDAHDQPGKIGREDEAKNNWDIARRKHEPALMNALRIGLQKHQFVKQVFDPWYMEANTEDRRPQVANEQHSGNEKLHANHLHITVKEPKIL